jgi:uncharacterized iron-regulated membrane protein
MAGLGVAVLLVLAMTGVGLAIHDGWARVDRWLDRRFAATGPTQTDLQWERAMARIKGGDNDVW